ncbi:phosphomannomutase [Acinetobacter sp. NCu2D-2]|uniref:phosphomannomutase/phosphoglucomutase n=1 Tax=Acinetobacter sp. NCu2D-2 TaxID=1608473 RepID=UPI0007CDD6EF|nr:phosphomannomutase/phosphoglucomutase [Acinetobacter sp. NCu2D-2]ANF81208.1 phosphomannomutase [Acinetobacter sp. NCu2D-2]
MNAVFPLHIFRAYDIRGKVSLLNEGVIEAIAHALAQQYVAAGQTRVAVGYDARLYSPAYAALIENIFKQYQLDVSIIGCCSSPMLYSIAKEFDGNGIMVTASHNPKDDNGIKWIVQNLPPCPDTIQQIGQSTEKMYSNNFQKVELQVHQPKAEFLKLYQDQLTRDIHITHSFKVVIDGLHGSAGAIAQDVLKKLNCEVIALRCDPNGNFPDHAPDPSVDAHLQLLQKAVVDNSADFGMALDGDGDRLVLVDAHGKIIRADRLLCLFAKICLNQQPNAEFVYDVKCSTLVHRTVLQQGGQPVMIRTGSSFLRRYLAASEKKAVFGGEYAGHYVFNDARGGGYDDGLYAALRIMEYLSQTHQRLDEALAEYPERFGTQDLYISTHGATQQAVLACVEKRSAQFAAQISKIDGIRLDFTDGFGIIRASNTGDYFTLRFDADTAERLDQIRQLFVSMLEDDFPDIAHDILDAQ